MFRVYIVECSVLARSPHPHPQAGVFADEMVASYIFPKVKDRTGESWTLEPACC